jgi:hypothetical protein
MKSKISTSHFIIILCPASNSAIVRSVLSSCGRVSGDSSTFTSSTSLKPDSCDIMTIGLFRFLQKYIPEHSAIAITTTTATTIPPIAPPDKCVDGPGSDAGEEVDDGEAVDDGEGVDVVLTLDERVEEVEGLEVV